MTNNRVTNEKTERIFCTAEAQRAQRKPNEDTLTSKDYRNTFNARIKIFSPFKISAYFASLR